MSEQSNHNDAPPSLKPLLLLVSAVLVGVHLLAIGAVVFLIAGLGPFALSRPIVYVAIGGIVVFGLLKLRVFLGLLARHAK